MGDYYCVRVWRLKPGATSQEVEHLASSSMVEVLPWIPGVKHFSFVNVAGSLPSSYLMVLTFIDQASYTYWRQVEVEAVDYWEHLAAIQEQWEQLCLLLVEYAGEMSLDVELGQADNVMSQ